MKTFALTVATKKQERLLVDLASELGIELTEAKFKPLTTKEVALGIGRKFTHDDLEEYLQRTAGGKTKSASKVKTQLARKNLPKLK